MNDVEKANRARVAAVVEFQSAAWDAVEARKKYGASSLEYRDAKAKTDAARAALAEAWRVWREASDCDVPDFAYTARSDSRVPPDPHRSPAAGRPT